MSQTDYAIIGAGIAGSSIAYHLSEKTDASITVYERQSPASETTFKSIAMFGLYGDETQYKMKRYGLRLYNDFFAKPKANPRYNFMGRLRVATTEEGNKELKSIVENSQGDISGTKIATGREHDFIEYIPAKEIKEKLLVPILETDSIHGGLYRPRVGYMNPQELAFEFINRAEDNGVTFVSNTRVTDIYTKNNGVESIELDEKEVVETDELICAAGPWNIKMSRMVGLDLPLKHTLAPWLLLEPDPSLPYTLPSIEPHETPYAVYRQRARSDRGIYIAYNPGSYQDAGTEYDPDTLGEDVPSEIREGILDMIENVLPPLLDAPVVEEAVGIRSVTPDGNPIVGWTKVEGFNIAAFNTSGIQLSPAVGKIIADQLVDGDPTSYYENLSVSRFDGHTDYREGI